MTSLPLAAHFATAPRLLDLRGEFPGVPEGWAYLDAAATAQKPRAVVEAITRAYAEDYATVHRGVYNRSSRMTEAYEAARETTARLINGRADETIFVRGATEAINLVANSWGSANIGNAAATPTQWKTFALLATSDKPCKRNRLRRCRL